MTPPARREATRVVAQDGANAGAHDCTHDRARDRHWQTPADDGVPADAGLLTLFAFFAAFVLVYFAWNTRRLITEQITETVDTEIQGLRDSTAKAAFAAGLCDR